MLNKETQRLVLEGWAEFDGQGNKHAREREFYCVVIPCNVHSAMALSELFYQHFRIRSCSHYDGKTLSLYCGDAGHGADTLMDTARALVEGYMASGGEEDSPYREDPWYSDGTLLISKFSHNRWRVIGYEHFTYTLELVGGRGKHDLHLHRSRGELNAEFTVAT